MITWEGGKQGKEQLQSCQSESSPLPGRRPAQQYPDLQAADVCYLHNTKKKHMKVFSSHQTNSTLHCCSKPCKLSTIVMTKHNYLIQSCNSNSNLDQSSMCVRIWNVGEILVPDIILPILYALHYW